MREKKRLSKFASNSASRAPLLENVSAPVRAKRRRSSDLRYEGGGEGVQVCRAAACCGAMVVACINHPSARHSHSRAPNPKPTPCMARASVVLDHPFRVSCATHTYTHTRALYVCSCTRASNLDTYGAYIHISAHTSFTLRPE